MNKIVFTLEQAAIYSKLPKTTLYWWIEQGYLPRAKAKYGIFIDPDDLDIVLETRAKFTPRKWPKHIEEVKARFEKGKIVTFSNTNASRLPYKDYTTKNGVRFRAVVFYSPFRVLSGNYVAKSNDDGGWLVRIIVDNKICLRIISHEKFRSQV